MMSENKPDDGSSRPAPSAPTSDARSSASSIRQSTNPYAEAKRIREGGSTPTKKQS